MRTLPFYAVLAGALLVGCQSPTNTAKADYQVIPLPQQIETTAGNDFILDAKTTIVYPKENELLKKNAQFLSEYIATQTGIKTSVSDTEAAKNIRLQLGLGSSNKEAYRLTVNENGILIEGASEAGVFYGIQTLRKAISAEKATSVALPPVTIDDAPRFAYRGAHLDVSRHFSPADSIKVFVDMLALHNINTFHWHLTDDQGWRVELDQYPGLTETGSKRKETVIGRNSGEYDGKPYGEGFYYTKDELKEIVQYAAERHITVIPEIDLPGHMQAALAAYPELGCTGGPYEVWTLWGVSEDVLCAGNPQVYEFLENVLNEVADIFPSEYFHIGGDECPKIRWEKCPKCQAKIKELGIKGDAGHSAEEYLQSHVITFAEEVLAKKGKKIIGWDEILEGGLAPNATVMSWRGIEGGLVAAQSGHDAIMTPTSFMYFDYYQTDDVADEPLAIGGYVPIEKVYSYEPVPAALDADKHKHILGVQANIWREYIPTFSHVQYMALPRYAALSEVQWTQPDRKDYENFKNRLPSLIKIYDAYGYNYAKHIFGIEAEIDTDTANGQITVRFSTLDDAPIYYTLDGSEPDEKSARYENPLQIKETTQLRAVAARPSGKTKVFAQDFTFHKATAKPIEVLTKINPPYSYKGASTLNDGRTGNQNFKTGRWIAFNGNDLEAVIDLQQPTEISKVSLNTNVITGDWIYDARSFSVAVSDDGQNFRTVASENYPQPTAHVSELRTHTLAFEPVQVRYVKITAAPEYNIPQWHTQAKGHKAYLFVDEIVVE